MSAYYAVKQGRVPGIYTTWTECQKQVDNYSGGVYKKFKVMIDAQSFINGHPVPPPAAVAPPQPITAPLQGQQVNVHLPMGGTNGHAQNNNGAAAMNTHSSSGAASSSSSSSTIPAKNPLCKCGLLSVTRITKKENANNGREFYTCAKPTTTSCQYFKWVDKVYKSDPGSRDNGDTLHDIIMYTDGGCKGNRNVAVTVNPAGW